MKKLGNDWDDFLEEETAQPYYLALKEFLKNEYKTHTIYPPMHDIFNSLRYTGYKDVKVVIIGQDPYINFGEAHGLSFSVNPGVKVPPSLRNIFKEICDDVGGYMPSHGCLVQWATQGVLLLNTVLTVREKVSKSHAGHGWEQFTTAVIKKINEKETPVVFLLWGNDAKAKQALLTNPNHLILTAAHPSPLAGGKFFSCKHFSKANEFLQRNGLTKIHWQIESVEASQ